MTGIRGLYSGGADDWVYFEVQLTRERLCGLHTLNNLLQGPVFKKGELWEIGAAFDEREAQMVGGSDGYAQASGDGYYGVDVMVSALQSRGYVMKHIHNPEFKELLTAPAKYGDSFILNHHNHWLAVRPVKGRWFSLNSLTPPEAISESRIDSYVSTMQSLSWTLFVVRPQQWPVQKMPEPDPLAWPNIPKVTTVKMHASGFYPFAIISRLAEDSGNNQDATAALPAPAEQPSQYEWPTQGGQTVAATSTRPEATATEHDAELAQVLRESVIDFKRTVPAPQPQPAEGGLMLKVTDATAQGSRGVVVSRRFSSDAPVLDLFRWLFKSDEVWQNNTVALGACEIVVVSAQFPNRQLVCESSGARVRLVESSSPTEAAAGGGCNVSGKRLAELFPNGGESLRLTYAL